MYDAEIVRFLGVDPLADSYPSWSPYNYVLGNSLKFTDPTGASVEGDIYNQNGVHIGNDGIDDNKAYVLDTESTDQLTTEDALSMTSAVSNLEGVCNVCFGGEQITELGIGNDELNIASTLLTIRKSENYGDPLPYNALYGGGTFDSYDSHPNQAVAKWGKRSTAAGAYQFLKTTWDEHAASLALSDFSPASQDRAAVAEISRVSGAMDLITSGNYDAALNALSGKWTSLPGGRHQNPNFNTSVFLESRATVIDQNR